MEERVRPHPLEQFMDPPSRELLIREVRGAKIFPLWKHDEVIVFVEYNGYRKMVTFPAEPAPASSAVSASSSEEQDSGTAGNLPSPSSVTAGVPDGIQEEKP